MFQVIGDHFGRLVTVTWDKGVVSSDDVVAMTSVEILADAAQRHRLVIGPQPGAGRDRDHLDDPLTALFLIMQIMEPASIDLTGDVPEALAPEREPTVN